MPRPRKPANPFRYFNSSPEVIRLVVMMYVRFPLSLRNVEDLLFERGVDICHETVRFGWNRFGPLFASENASAILLESGNAVLKPERATTWSTTLAVHPQAITGLRAELTYFSVRYRDRIAEPITFETTALADDILEDVITLAPSEAAALSSAASVNNLLDGPYDPAEVVAIIDNRNHTVARQRVSGIDLFVDYLVEMAGSGRLNLTANAAYLRSRHQINAQQPVVTLAGAIFNPPHLRASGGATWSDGPLNLSTFANYTGKARR